MLTLKYVAGKSYLEKIENFGADGSRASGHHLHVASQNGLNLPYNVHARSQGCRTLSYLPEH
jgi:hypothetical protein